MTDPEQMTDAELTRAMAVEVMGWTAVVHCSHSCWRKPRRPHKAYEYILCCDFDPLTDPNDRDKVVDAMLDKNEFLQFTHERYTAGRSGGLLIRKSSVLFWEGTRPGEEAETIADTAGRAVCVAALKATRQEKEK